MTPFYPEAFDLFSGASGIAFPDNSTVRAFGNVNTALNLASSTGKLAAGLSGPGDIGRVQEGLQGIGTTSANAAASRLFSHVSARQSVSFSFGRAPVSSSARLIAGRASPHLFFGGIATGLVEYNFTARFEAEMIQNDIQGIRDSGRISAGYRQQYQDLKGSYEKHCGSN